jgi:hypothetical protein
MTLDLPTVGLPASEDGDRDNQAICFAPITVDV